MLKLIFLDVDGVFVTGDYIIERYNITGKPSGHVFDPKSIERFNRVIRETDAKVVVSSTWRMGRTIDELQTLFDSKGFVGIEVVGKTEFTSHGIRGKEIQTYLNNMDVKPSKFVILDDDADMEHLMPYLFKTDFSTGLTDEVTENIIKYLNS
jgi:hypothetical protein